MRRVWLLGRDQWQMRREKLEWPPLLKQSRRVVPKAFQGRSQMTDLQKRHAA